MLHYVASTKVETLKPQFSRVVCCPQWLVVIFTCDVSHLHTLTSPSVAYWSYYIINLFPLTFNNPHLDPDKIDRQKLGISSGTDYIYTYTYVCIYIRYHVIHMYIYIFVHRQRIVVGGRCLRDRPSYLHGPRDQDLGGLRDEEQQILQQSKEAVKHRMVPGIQRWYVDSDPNRNN